MSIFLPTSFSLADITVIVLKNSDFNASNNVLYFWVSKFPILVAISFDTTLDNWEINKSEIDLYFSIIFFICSIFFSYSPLKKSFNCTSKSAVMVFCWQKGHIPSLLIYVRPLLTQSALSRKSISLEIGTSLFPTITFSQIKSFSIVSSSDIKYETDISIVLYFSGLLENRMS